MSTELQFNKYFASVQLIVLNSNGFVFKNQCRTPEPSGEQGAFSTYHYAEATCSLQSSQNSDCISICVLWVTLTSPREVHPICSLSVGTDLWIRTGPQFLLLHRAGTAHNTSPEMQWTAELQDFQIPNMGERTAVSQWGLYTPMPSLAAKWTCCMHCPLFTSSLIVKSTKETLVELSPTCPLTYSR